MAKAGDTSTTIVWIWLREALELAVRALGSVALAKEQLIEWLAAGKLPWSCMKWNGLDAEDIAKAEQLLREGPIIHILPSAAYHEGDPKFWRVRLQIDWEDNAACEPVTGGARALGIKVSRKHFLLLLPEESRERDEALQQTEPAERNSMPPKVWLAKVRKEHPQRQNESHIDYTRRLHNLMKAAPVTRQWTEATLYRRLYE
jgi:hypothetical protein